MKKQHDMKNKAVSFNLLDPDQVKLYEHAMKRKNFSAYVKRLIQKDIDSAFYVAQHQMQTETEHEEPSSLEEDEGLMSGLI